MVWDLREALHLVFLPSHPTDTIVGHIPERQVQPDADAYAQHLSWRARRSGIGFVSAGPCEVGE